MPSNATTKPKLDQDNAWKEMLDRLTLLLRERGYGPKAVWGVRLVFAWSVVRLPVRR